MQLTDDQIRSRLAPFQVDLGSDQLALLRNYVHLLELWNRKISLVSSSDISHLLERHIGESLFAASAAPIRYGRLADVGTGAGFPGIPLKILVSGLELTLIDSNQRKSAFLSETVRLLQLSTCKVVGSRYEDFDSPYKFNFITCRAVGKYEDLLKWAQSRLTEGGEIVLWLGVDDAEQLSKITGWNWREPILIPSSNRRVLLIGRSEFLSNSGD